MSRSVTEPAAPISGTRVAASAPPNCTETTPPRTRTGAGTLEGRSTRVRLWHRGAWDRRADREGGSGGRAGGRLPAPGSPFAQVGPLGAERGVVTVPGVDPRVVVVDVEDPVLDVVDQGLEALVVVAAGRSDATGEQRVPGEDVGGAGRVVVG